MKNLNKAFVAIVILALAGVAWPKDLYVAGQDPQASDKGTGAETAPFKTIQPAVDAAQPGDTIYVKAGRYEDVVRINKSGFYDAPITLSAWKDDRVEIGFKPRPLPVEGAWQALPGTKCFQVKLTADMPEDFVVVLNDKAVGTLKQDAPPKDDQVTVASYRKSDRTLMFNANGKDPSALGQFQYGRFLDLFAVMPRGEHWVIRKIEFNWSSCAMALCSNNCIVEDCFFTRTYRPGIFLHGRTNIIRRCNFYRCGYALNASGVGPANILEDNLMVECGQSAEEDVSQIGAKYPEGGGPTVFKGNNLAMMFQYNTVSENRCGAGWYADIDAKSCRIIGNAFWNNPGAGIYNEYAVDDTMVMGNYFFQNACTSAMCMRLNIVDNFFDDAGVVWHIREWWPLRNGYMFMRGNAFVNPPSGYLSNYGAGWGQNAYPEGFTNCMVDFNKVRLGKDVALLNDGGDAKKYKAIEDVRAKFGWELHGECKPYDKAGNDLTPESMGGSTVTYRIPWGKRSYEARPMLANADMEDRWPAAPEMVHVATAPAFFWRIADGTGDPSPLWAFDPHFPFLSRWQPGSAGYELAENAGCRWYVDAEAKFPDMTGKMPAGAKIEGWPTVPALSNGNHWVTVQGLTPKDMPPAGVGYWSPLLGAAPGAKVTISMKIRGTDIASDDKNMPVAWLEFTNETGQGKTRAFLIGLDDQGKMHHPELTKGSFAWTEIKETIVAPDNAVRMALFFGIRPCKGKLDFDDVNIKTASEAAPAMASETLPPRTPIARFRNVFFIDLATVANRALADDVDNDGKGGWTDQGPEADMRELATGDRKFGGVPFKIAPAPRSVVVLKSSMRSKGDLPAAVTIPVGRKLDSLFFLHAAAWVGGNEYFKYVIHYADGKDVTVPVGPTNLTDWTGEPIARFPNEEGTFSTVAQTVKVPMFRQGSVYRMEWSAPAERRPIEIKSIEMVGNGTAIPVLLGITGILEW
jgi:hypothetical protein